MLPGHPISFSTSARVGGLSGSGNLEIATAEHALAKHTVSSSDMLIIDGGQGFGQRHVAERMGDGLGLTSESRREANEEE